MLDDIKKNKRKTAVIVSGFIIMITLILYYICMAFNLDSSIAIIIALLFSIISCFASYYNSDKIILRTCKARPATLEEDRKLVHIFEAIMISSGLPCQPRLYVVDDPQPNAFATGRNPQNAIICVTTGLLEKLDYYELEGVIAHEMGHIRNYDILLSAVVTVMVGFVVMLSDMFTRICFYGRRRNDDDDNKGSAILMLVGLIFLILGPIFGKIMQMAISRRREFLADATAVEITRNPQGLISALKKLDSDSNELRFANSATAHMYIVNPFKDSPDKKKRKAGLLDTHPSIDERIEALENIQ
ncbi:MAG: M48 family metallopeptidase [Clostridia bacterium]|nr:M48 family metallopeptidase [Clostridia bacterium]